VDDRSTTEEMRQAMANLLAMGRDLLSESDAAAAAPTTREAVAPDAQPAGQPAGEPSGDRRFAG
jgi:hypothetical protein